MDAQSWERQAEQAGIILEYEDAWGVRKKTSTDTLRQLLAAMPGVDEDGVAPASLLPPVWVTGAGRSRQRAIPALAQATWTLVEESGRQHQGTLTAGLLELPAVLAEGYHQLSLQTPEGVQHDCRVIEAPLRCYEPPALLAGERLWGSCIQLYTLRSRRNWGIGDFGDLALMIEGIAGQGGAFVGLNPIHALYPATPAWNSPYSPSSRRWLNIIYIDVGGLEDFVHSEPAQRWWLLPQTQQRLQALRSADLVDYAGVMALKMTALQLAWQNFNQRLAADPQHQAFADFIRAGGESLRQQAVFDALHAWLNHKGPVSQSWQQWPAEYQQWQGAGVNAFCQQHPDQIAFYSWLQWQAVLQFDACFRLSQRLAMPIGIYRDLAVGVGAGGVETWSDDQLYCLKVTVGAPPDPLGPQGQNWGLPPQDPLVLKQRGYQPFIDMLRANMRHCGALRIDHVMSLLRLWWIPLEGGADQGAYVSYPVEDLLAVLALESQRQRCMIIGEDLGTVPAQITATLQQAGIYSYKVLFFERPDADSFRAPDDYLPQAMATLTTHDLATLRGFWQHEDLLLGQKLQLYPGEEVYQQLMADRSRARQALLNALHQWQCIDDSLAGDAGQLAMSPALNRGIHHYLAISRSALLGLQPEDWLAMALPVNVPGTTDQYPNWQRKLTREVEEIFADEQIRALLSDVSRWRTSVGPGV